MSDTEGVQNDNPQPSANVDGGFRIKVSRDGLMAYFSSLTAASGSGSVVSPPQVLKKLKVDKVIYGIDQARIGEILDQFNSGRLAIDFAESPLAPEQQEKRNSELCIARGDPPVHGADGAIDWKISKAHIEAEDYYIVPGELIATISAPGKGAPGKDVYGNEIKCRPGLSNIPKLGKGIETKQSPEEAALRASALGVLSMAEGVLQVLSPVSIAEDKMSASIDLSLPSDSSQTFTLDHIIATLKQSGVQFGICEDVLNEALHTLLQTQQPLSAVLAAKGRGVVQGSDGSISWCVDSERVKDHHLVVKKGELVGVCHNAVPGQVGYDVTKKLADPPQVKEAVLPKLDGIGIYPKENKKELRAERYGYLTFEIENEIKQVAIKPALTVSDDQMEVTTDLFAKTVTGKEVTAEELVEALTTLGVTHGIDKVKIENLLIETRQHEPPCLPNQVIAKGTPVENGKDAKLVIYHKENSAGVEMAKGRFNFHEHNYPWNVDEGQTVGYFFDVKPEAHGVTLFGKTVKAKPPKKIRLELKGLHCDEKGKLVADLSGALLIAGTRLTIVDLLVINNDVDIHSGNIHSSTSVHVKGHIAPGYEVESKKDIVVERNIENAKVHAGGELVIKGGIRGMDSEVFAAGDVTTKFIENAAIFVNGSVHVAGSIINSRVASNESISVGGSGAKHSAVIGGELIAHNSVVAKELGGTRYAKTIVKVGLGQETRRELNRLDEEIAVKKKEIEDLNQIEYHYKKHSKANAEELFQKITATRAALTAEIDNLEAELNKLRETVIAAGDPTVIVEMRVYPGVVIELNGITYQVKNELGAGSFVLKEGEVSFRPKVK